MAVTPLNAGYKLKISYTSDLPHVNEVFCDAHASGSTYILDEFGGTTTPTATFISTYIGLVQPFFDVTALFVGWTLEKFVSGAYVEVDAGSIGLNGTASGGTNKSSSHTWVFRDSVNARVALRWLGVNQQFSPFKSGYAQISGAYLSFVNDCLSTVHGHVGAIFRGRSATVITRFLDVVGSYNRKSRRRLNLI